MPKVIGIIGTRRRDSAVDLEKVNDAFLKVYEEGDTICSGGCPKGGDLFAAILAKLYQTKTLWFPPDWKRFGWKAGLERNWKIAKKSDILIACVAPDRKGGTEDTIKKFLRLGKTNLILVE